MYLNVFDLRTKFKSKDYDTHRHAEINVAFNAIYGALPSKEYFSQVYIDARQVGIYTHDLDWQVTARLMGVEEYLFEFLEQIIHRVSPLIARVVPLLDKTLDTGTS